MQNKNVRPIVKEEPSIGSSLREVGNSVKDLLQSEVNLAKTEMREASQSFGRHSAQAAIFGGLLAVSVLPFLAFLVVGLGRVMNGNYWLSSLIVAVICAAVGGSFAYRAYQKMKQDPISLPRSRESLERSKDVVTDRVKELQNTKPGRAA